MHKEKKRMMEIVISFVISMKILGNRFLRLKDQEGSRINLSKNSILINRSCEIENLNLLEAQNIEKRLS